MPLRLSLAIFAILSLTLLHGQTKAPVQPKDYAQWESIPTFRNAISLSPDGKWLVTQVNHSSRENELRFTRISDGTVKTIAFATQPTFSSDSQWAVYSIGQSEAATEKARKDKKPVQSKLGLIHLTDGSLTVVDAVESALISPDGKYVAFRKYSTKKEDSDTDEAIAGATLVIRTLSTGRDSSFGNVAEFAWQDEPGTSHWLAMTIHAEDKAGNALELYDPQTGNLRVLDAAASTYAGLVWQKKSANLAVLRSVTDTKREGPGYVALAWTHLGQPGEKTVTYSGTLADDMRIVSYRRPLWADGGETIFLGIGKWKPKVPEKKGEVAKDQDEPAAVDVWHWRDAQVMPRQKISAKSDAQKNLLVAWHLAPNQIIPLAKTLTEQVTPVKGGKLAVASDWSNYTLERSIGRPTADISLIDTSTGARTKLKDHLFEDPYLTLSPGGRYALYLEKDDYWTVNLQTRAVVNITRGVKTSFINKESDETVVQKPPYGVAGWSTNDEAVLLYDQFDLWQLAPDGSAAKKLTDGAAQETRHRYLKLYPDEEFIDLTRPTYLSLFGKWTKKSGFAVMKSGKEEHTTYEDRNIGRLTIAKDAATLAYVSESFQESPRVVVDGKAVLVTNPNQSNFAWGRGEIIEYKNSKGERLQGALYYPAGYTPGRTYPMVIYMYEKLSDNVHHYVAPSERDYYNTSVLTANGYVVLHPDIVFRPREPGLSVQDCVTAAAKKVIAMGVAEPKKIGVVGHSWGGFDASFLATHSDLFAAAVAGAPITDLVSNYGNHHWSSGIAETDHIETGQQRMEVPIYEDLQAYIRNSAVFNVQNMKVPLLIEVGDADGTVFFHQGVELYNIARRARKNVVLLVYGAEDHGLRKKADQIDYQHRILAWFGHYLKGETAPSWITDGESYLTHQDSLKAAKGR